MEKLPSCISSAFKDKALGMMAVLLNPRDYLTKVNEGNANIDTYDLDHIHTVLANGTKGPLLTKDDRIHLGLYSFDLELLLQPHGEGKDKPGMPENSAANDDTARTVMVPSIPYKAVKGVFFKANKPVAKVIIC